MTRKHSIARTIPCRRIPMGPLEILPAGRLPAARPCGPVRTYSEIGKRSIHTTVRWEDVRTKPDA